MCPNSRSNKQTNKQATKQTNNRVVSLFFVFSGCRSAACSIAAAASEDDQKKEEMIHEIHRLRERIKCLETDNASMHTKLSKEQKNVSQRLAEIEMQINDENEFSYGEQQSQSPKTDEDDEIDEDDDEINRESFI